MVYDNNKDSFGEGRFCHVFRAKYKENGLVAVKQWKADVRHVPEQYEDIMRREARCLNNLLHPNVIKLIGTILEPNMHAIVMEYYANGDLTKFSQNHHLNTHLKAKILLNISRGIQYLHWLPKQIIRNDLKAGNILISDDITAKIKDFGMADWTSFTTEIFILDYCRFLKVQLIHTEVPKDGVISVNVIQNVMFTVLES